MDYYTTADLAKLLDGRANLLDDSDPEFAKQLRICAHFLRLYAALEHIYRERLEGSLEEISDQVNSLFRKDQTG